MSSHDTSAVVSRRTLLKASSGVLAVSAVGRVGASDDHDHDDHGHDDDDTDRRGRCPDATIRPSMGHCEGATMDGCADDHPETEALRDAVADTLETQYPDVGSLLEAGFLPYFDVKLSEESNGWSHWLSPEYIGDDTTLDPDRPESVLVDNESWRPIGVMFIATQEGDTFEPPPPVYEAGDVRPDDEQRCSPWHYHAGLPGRFAWWYYLQVHEKAYRDGQIRLPCRTPCMMHVWTVPHPEGVYAHGGPPPENRTQEPAQAGFETDAEPGEDTLGWNVLPAEYVPDQKPGEFSRWPR